MSQIKKILFAFSPILIGLVILGVSLTSAYAHERHHECEHDCQASPTPTSTPLASPLDCGVIKVEGDSETCLPSPTPAEPEVSPAPKLCTGEHMVLVNGDTCVSSGPDAIPFHFPDEPVVHGLMK